MLIYELHNFTELIIMFFLNVNSVIAYLFEDLSAKSYIQESFIWKSKLS